MGENVFSFKDVIYFIVIAGGIYGAYYKLDKLIALVKKDVDSKLSKIDFEVKCKAMEDGVMAPVEVIEKSVNAQNIVIAKINVALRFLMERDGIKGIDIT